MTFKQAMDWARETQNGLLKSCDSTIPPWKSLFNGILDTDVTLVFGEHRIKAHKELLCKASKWFRTALSKDCFLEASASVIELKGDNPNAILAMLKHIYDFPDVDYLPQSKKRKLAQLEDVTEDPDLTVLTNLRFYVSIYAAADKYDVTTLRQKVVPLFIQGLKEVVPTLLDTDNLIALLDLIYDSTVMSDDTLRQGTLQCLNDKLHVLYQSNSHKLKLFLEACPEAACSLTFKLLSKDDTYRQEARERELYGFDDDSLLELASMHSLKTPLDDFPLHESARYGDLLMFTGVVWSEDDIRTLDHHGETPLHWAASEGGNLMTVRYLVSWAARMDYDIISVRSDHYGRSALDWAKEAAKRSCRNSERLEIVEFLSDVAKHGHKIEECCRKVDCWSLPETDECDDDDCTCDDWFDDADFTTSCQGHTCCDACQVSKFVDENVFWDSMRTCPVHGMD